jgi:hypothetical protein
MNEVHWIGDGAKRTLVLGSVPKISIDVRIRCPRTFTSEFPPPPPPTPRYSELAGRAAQKIVTAIWSFRHYVEVIKVGYALDDQSPNTVYVTGEIVLVTPTGEKISTARREHLGHKYGRNGMTFELTGVETEYETIFCSLANGLVRALQNTIQRREGELKSYAEQLQQFRAIFAAAEDTP